MRTGDRKDTVSTEGTQHQMSGEKAEKLQQALILGFYQPQIHFHPFDLSVALSIYCTAFSGSSTVSSLKK